MMMRMIKRAQLYESCRVVYSCCKYYLQEPTKAVVIEDDSDDPFGDSDVEDSWFEDEVSYGCIFGMDGGRHSGDLTCNGYCCFQHARRATFDEVDQN